MASTRPTSMIIPPGVFDETNTNGAKNVLQKKDSQSTRSTNQPTFPVNNLINAHSSSSSIDSAGAKTAILIEKNSFSPINLMTTVSSTTTDSDLESEQEERFLEDNHSSESTPLPNQTSKTKTSRCDSLSRKTDVHNTQEQLSRRVKHFQKLFKSDISDSMPDLIDSYVCAYQGDILLQGKMYITDRYLCFHSRIISYVTKHVYRWEQIENVSKERVAFIFPTAIGIQLKSTGKKIIYASFLQRDQAYDKILSICSRFSNDSSSFQDDDSNHHRNYMEKSKKSKREMHFEMSDELEQDDVLQMCLPSEKSNHNKRPALAMSKSNDEKQQQQQQSSKKLINSDKKKSGLKHLNTDQNFTENNLDQSMRNSRYSNNQSNQVDTTLQNSSTEYRQTYNNSFGSDETRSSQSPSNRALSNLPNLDSSSNSMTTLINPTNDGFLKKYVRTILLAIISIIQLLSDYFSLLFHQFKKYPIKTSFILFIFITILVVHSFYLIKLAYRIENRLQSLHHKWPSSSSSMKNSLPSLNEL